MNAHAEGSTLEFSYENAIRVAFDPWDRIIEEVYHELPIYSKEYTAETCLCDAGKKAEELISGWDI